MLSFALRCLAALVALAFLSGCGFVEEIISSNYAVQFDITPRAPAGGSVGTRSPDISFRFELQASGILTTYTTGDANTYGTVFDRSEEPATTVAEDDNSGSSYNFKIETYIDPGFYDVSVYSQLPATQPYTLNVEFSGDMESQQIPVNGR